VERTEAARLPAGALNRLDADGPSGLAFKQPMPGPLELPPLAQDLQQQRGQHDVAISLSLALIHADHPALAADIGDFQIDGFGYP
jgi:hypothetical protein